jgi:excisionase family DNA binding protein
MANREVYVCDFELLDRGERVVALPVGIDGVTEGYNFTDAIRMSADWLRETALDFLMRGEAWPELPLGTEPTSGGRMVTIAVEVGLGEVPAVTASEAAARLGVSTARIAQLCKAGLLDSWKVGRTRMVSLESVETRCSEKTRPGRPRKEKIEA